VIGGGGAGVVPRAPVARGGHHRGIGGDGAIRRASGIAVPAFPASLRFVRVVLSLQGGRTLPANCSPPTRRAACAAIPS